jgi:hypothetical protein
MGTRVGKTLRPVRLEHHDCRLERLQGDSEQLFLVAKAQLALLHFLVHRSDRVEHLGEIGLPRSAKRFHRLTIEQFAGQYHQLSKRRAQPLLDSGRQYQGEQGRQQRSGQKPITSTEVGADKSRVGMVEVEQKPSPLEIYRSGGDQKITPFDDDRVVPAEQIRRVGGRQRKLR